jgi:DNA ligase-associated metallophosphoesterase
MNKSSVIEWAGEKLELLPEKAIWWAREKTFFIADPHFGKASTFRFVGIPVPETTHDDDLETLDRILKRRRAKRLVILGDFFHARTGWSDATLQGLSAWRERNAKLEIVLIKGNHDRQAGPPLKEWRIESVNGPWAISPFLCVHEPQEIPDAFVLAGHIHPSFYLKDRASSGLQHPCFYFGRNLAILPAFGNFTGTHPIRAKENDRIFVVGENEIIDVSAATRKINTRRKT